MCELVQRCDLLAAVGADEVSLEKVVLNTFFAVCGTTTRGFHSILEEFAVDRTCKGGVSRGSFSDVVVSEGLRPSYLLLP